MSDVSRFMQQEVSRLKEENTILRDEVYTLREYLKSLQALMNAVNHLDTQAEIMPLLDNVLASAMTVTGAQDASLLVVDEETQELAFVVSRGDQQSQSLIGQRIPSGKGIAGWVAQTGKPAIVSSAHTDPRFYPGIDDAFSFTTNSILATPIIGGGKVIGVIEVLNKHNDMPFAETDQILLVLLCRFAGEVLNVMSQQEEKSPAL
jgi:GAF domain-containing protein